LKICSKCKKEKALDSFYESNNKLNGWCKDCFRAWYKSRSKILIEIAETECEFCKTIFLPKIRVVGSYCSRECKIKARNKRLSDERIASKKERVCLHCSTVITKERRADAKFCSAECNYKAHQLQRKLRNRANEEGKRGYLRTEICERDGWICQICKEPVERNAHHPNPLAPSLDHIIPVSKGGSSDPSNLQLTHLVCNLKRGNRAL
jgi:hypothetical protein